MSANVDAIVEKLLPEYINKNVLMVHDVARETFGPGPIAVADFQEFATRVTEYVVHHHVAVGDGKPPASAAFGEAKRILTNYFTDDPFQEGYNVALLMGRSGSGGGMRTILNVLADQLKRQALHNHKEHVFHTHVDVLSSEENSRLARAYFARFGEIVKRFLPDFDEKTFASNVRAAVEYHLQVVELVLGVGRKL